MNKHFRKVLSALKTRKDVTALGFSRKELKGIAARVADKLNLEEDAAEEDVNDAIDDAIESVMPFLQVAQTVSERRLQSYKDSLKPDDDKGDDDDDDEESDVSQSRKLKKGGGKEKDDGDKSDGKNDPAWFTAISALTETINSLKTDISAIKSGSIANSRRSRVEELIKDTGKFGERVMRSFSRMSFQNDDEFEDYLDEVKEDLEAENQERANAGLEALSTPPSTTQKKDDKEEVYSDDEIKALAAM